MSKLKVKKIKEFFKKIKLYKNNREIYNVLFGKADTNNSELNALIDKYMDSEYAIGIHRTGHNMGVVNQLDNYFYNGLINPGDIASGAVGGDSDINNTVSFYNSPFLLSDAINKSYGYKDSEGVMIVIIPKSYIGLAEGEVKPIYIEMDNIKYMLPEFIYGYVPVSKKGVENIIKNPNYSDYHNYQDQDLVYDDSVYFQALKNNVELPGKNFKIRQEKTIEKEGRTLYQAIYDTIQISDINTAIVALKNYYYLDDTTSFSPNYKAIKFFVKRDNIPRILNRYLNIQNASINDMDSLINQFVNLVSQNIIDGKDKRIK